MKSEFMAAVTQLSSERNLPKEIVLSILESALISAYKKGIFSPEQDITVKIDTTEVGVRVYINKTVTESVTNSLTEISLTEAQRLRDDYQIGDKVAIEATPKNAGRIAAQTAKQVVLQRLREAEHNAIYEQYTAKENEIVSGMIHFIQPKQITVSLGKAEAILPANEQVASERYRPGQQLKFYLLDIHQGMRGPQIIVSRSHPSLLRRLFETEIPEIGSGIVELKSIAREAGRRSKIAVVSHQEGVDPVGCCLGTRGIRLQSIISELNGEKIDIIQWHSDFKIFISNAISPAQVSNIELDEEQNTATVVVPDRQLSLAIGKEGQNARLAAKLTGWRIDIKSVSAVEAEKASLRNAAEVLMAVEEKQKEEVATTVVQIEDLEKMSVPSLDGEKELQEKEIVSEEEEDIGTLLGREEFQSVKTTLIGPIGGIPILRFAEDILQDRQQTEKSKKKAASKGKAKGKGRKKQKEHVDSNDSEE
jgi:transcription termination/antitermination protein NusA